MKLNCVCEPRPFIVNTLSSLLAEKPMPAYSTRTKVAMPLLAVDLQPPNAVGMPSDWNLHPGPFTSARPLNTTPPQSPRLRFGGTALLLRTIGPDGVPAASIFSLRKLAGLGSVLLARKINAVGFIVVDPVWPLTTTPGSTRNTVVGLAGGGAPEKLTPLVCRSHTSTTG